MKNKVSIVEEISETLCLEFRRALPLHQELKRRGKKPSEQDIKAQTESALQRFYQRADEEKSHHHLGIIGRARVALGLQKRLLSQGYPVPLVKQVLMAMLASAFVGNRRQ